MPPKAKAKEKKNTHIFIHIQKANRLDIPQILQPGDALLDLFERPPPRLDLLRITPLLVRRTCDRVEDLHLGVGRRGGEEEEDVRVAVHIVVS